LHFRQTLRASDKTRTGMTGNTRMGDFLIRVFGVIRGSAALGLGMSKYESFGFRIFILHLPASN
jgi:hypothetical protein